ncbi:MAG: alpha/beta hydrolase [Bryobacteraceae bacterium]|jgi:pimeloyl-ACP methyl ester carboxylesterase
MSSEPTHLSLHLNVDGKRLETLWLPPSLPDKPAIVLLHEGLGSIALWKNFPQLLAERTSCGVLVYSRYGHGRSECLAENRAVDYMHREAEVVLPALLNQMNITKPVLMGHSDGASIALIYAGRFPHAPRGLILEAPHVFVEERALRGIEKTKARYATTDLSSRLGRYHEHPDELFRGWSDIWLDPSFSEWNIESYLSSIQCPVLLVQGEDDEYGTARQLDAIQARIPSAQVLMLPHCGHSPHLDQPEAVLPRVVEFIGLLS